MSVKPKRDGSVEVVKENAVHQKGPWDGSARPSRSVQTRRRLRLGTPMRWNHMHPARHLRLKSHLF